MGSTRVLSATRLIKVDPSAPANVHRLQNAVVGLVIVSDADKLEDLQTGQNGVDGVKHEDGAAADGDEVKQESEPVKTEEDGEAVKEEEGAEDAEEEDEDGEPVWKEEIGWREVAGFLTM
jgi:polyribonucleotide 5'-hydroxyl-kinase